MALVLPLALLLAGTGLRLTHRAYPGLDLGALLALWAVVVLPAIVVVSSLSFVLGTLLPRLSNLVKVVVLVGWLLLDSVRAQGSGMARSYPLM